MGGDLGRLILDFSAQSPDPAGHRVNYGRRLCEIIPSSRQTMTKGNLEERVSQDQDDHLSPTAGVISLASKGSEVHPEAYQ
jgi:hypothetical protein